MPARLDPRLAGALAVALIAGAVVAILAFGRTSYPAFPSLRERPDPAITGTIAFARYDDDAGGMCLWALPASGAGAPRRLRCGHVLSGPVAWEGELIAVEQHTGGAAPVTLLLDPETGDVRDRRPDIRRRPAPPAGDLLITDARDGRACLSVESDAGSRRVACVQGPRDYGWWSAQWSPDRRHAVVHDSAQRLLVVRIEDGVVRLLAEDTGEAVWGPSAGNEATPDER